MTVKFLERSFFQRLLGISATTMPIIEDCWDYSDGKLIIDLGKALELATPGGASRFEGKNLPKRVLVVYGEDGEYRAFHNYCTHLGHRRLDPVPGTNTVQCCSISKSTYDPDGEKIFGPAPHPIIRFPVKKEQENLIVSIN
ncbi:iron-sulfur cluster-binding protein (Rieskeprotein, 2Fe-2S protein) [Desulforapulum autotrophicum HRM2]|uniref:Iron-sulfur cluster-binding protein (Rieskeprotein, 2Fe-2S protein) n=1 Tax=Desulforapulum autotrophicum (strain ATCC 43914 / DSM 3382 / VKM B-1955 / HRM2) TaxID=177437 RepID=C0QFT8_DESAH|nr:Rieske (2Fe-2S) protein [Desulforapulum autotrophicum]ACN15506.1 iron-sulfur cluster-binding protein (Rieskeprotein, 2Fe-2S protein) [Desulforapulum autotrophicum HRM2]